VFEEKNGRPRLIRGRREEKLVEGKPMDNSGRQRKTGVEGETDELQEV